MQESKGDHENPSDENPSDETPRFELRLSSDDAAGDDAGGTEESATEQSATEEHAPEVADASDVDIYGSTSADEDVQASDDRGETFVAEEEESEFDQAFETAEDAPQPVLAFEVPDVEASAEPEQDEVLVFQIDDEEDQGPLMPDGVEDEGDVAVYGELGEDDEFGELGETWEARLNGDEALEEVEAVPDRRRAVALAAGAGALVAFLIFSLGGDDTTPAADDTEQIARNESSNSRTDRDRPANTDRTEGAATNDRSGESPSIRREPREPRSMVAGIQNLFGTYSSTAPESLGPDDFEGSDSLAASLFGGDGETQRREGFLPVGDQVVLPDALPNLQMADASAFVHLWLEPGLPPGGVQNASYLQTPLFGDARVHMHSEEFFDGRLVGLGGGRLVIETGAGQLTLHADQVGPIAQLLYANMSSVETLVARTTGERIQVRAAGGWLSGEVVRQDGESVTLLLESGGRITVDRADVRPAANTMRPRLAEPPVAG